MIDGLNFRGKSSMNAENFPFNHGCDRKIIENFCAVLPRIGISILSNRLIIESIYLGDLSGLVVSSKQRDVTWVLELKAEQELECLH